MTVMDVVTEEMTIVKEIMANCQELKLQDQQKSPTCRESYRVSFTTICRSGSTVFTPCRKENSV